MEDSRQSVAALQSQLEDYRERSRKDLQEVQRNNKDRLVELQRAQSNLKAQQDEVGAPGLNGLKPSGGEHLHALFEDLCVDEERPIIMKEPLSLNELSGSSSS